MTLSLSRSICSTSLTTGAFLERATSCKPHQNSFLSDTLVDYFYFYVLFISSALGQKQTSSHVRRMSALPGGLNRSTQHSISFFLLEFESQGLAQAASDPKVPVFSAAVKPRKYARHIVIHSSFPLQEIECCVDRLSRLPKADIRSRRFNVRFVPIADIPKSPARMKKPASRRSLRNSTRYSTSFRSRQLLHFHPEANFSSTTLNFDTVTSSTR